MRKVKAWYLKEGGTGALSLIKVSIGLQAGGQAFSEMMFFEDKRAYDEFTSGEFAFDAQASAVAITAGAQAQAGSKGASVGASAGPATGVQAETKYRKGMIVFVHAKGGLMYEASIGGQKFNFKPKEKMLLQSRRAVFTSWLLFVSMMQVLSRGRCFSLEPADVMLATHDDKGRASWSKFSALRRNAMVQHVWGFEFSKLFHFQMLFQGLPIIGKFIIVFGLIVVLPKLAERFGLPGVLGLMMGGILLGPNLLGLVNPKASTIELFSELGKLLLMFFAGYEVNLQTFIRVGKRAAGYGCLTFGIPLMIGTGAGIVLGYSLNASILLGSLMASHTLLGLPILKRLGLTQMDAAIITVGATIFTDIAAMLVLAICLSVHAVGFSWAQLSIVLIELAIYVPLVVFGLSSAAKWLFARIQSEEMQFGILILMVTAASILAEVIELEGIVGAFLTGIAVNMALTNENEIVHSLSVIGHGLFIPVFFLSTGFLVNFKILANTVIHDYTTVFLVVGGLLLAKYLAARLAGKCYHLKKDETLLMWSLSIPQVAATLAAAIVAFYAQNPAGERLLSEVMLNAVIVLIVVTSIVGPVLTERFGSRLQAPILVEQIVS